LLVRLFIFVLLCVSLVGCTRTDEVSFPVPVVKAEIDCSIPPLVTPLVNTLQLYSVAKDGRIATEYLSLDYTPVVEEPVDPVVGSDVEGADSTTDDGEDTINDEVAQPDDEFYETTVERALTELTVLADLKDAGESLSLDDGTSVQLSAINVRLSSDSLVTSETIEDSETLLVSNVDGTNRLYFDLSATYAFEEMREGCEILGQPQSDETNDEDEGLSSGDSNNPDSETKIVRLIDVGFRIQVDLLKAGLQSGILEPILDSGVSFEDTSGASVSTNGAYVAVGVPGDDINANHTLFPSELESVERTSMDSGAVKLYQRDLLAGTLELCAVIKASNGRAGDEFGSRVLLRDDTLLVSALGEDSNGEGLYPYAAVEVETLAYTREDSGAVYQFAISEGCLVSEQAYFKNPNNGDNSISPNAEFGFSIAENNGDVLIGAPDQISIGSDATGERIGAIYEFAKNQDDEWAYQRKYASVLEHADQRFGHAISALDGYLLVGIPGDGSDATDLSLYNGVINAADVSNDALDSVDSSGAAMLFVRPSSFLGYEAVSYLKPENSDLGDRFGLSVALVGDDIFVSAPFEDSNSDQINVGWDVNVAENYNSGAVYRFKRTVATDGSIELVLDDYIKSRSPKEGAKFGSVMSAENGLLAVSNSEIVSEFGEFVNVSGHVELVDYRKTDDDYCKDNPDDCNTYPDPTYLSVFEDAAIQSPFSVGVSSMDLYGGVLVLGLPDAEVNGLPKAGAFTLWE